MAYILMSLMTNFQPPPLQLVCPKSYRQGFSSDFEQFFLIKNNFVYLQEQIWLPNRKFYWTKNKLYFDQEEMLKMAWYSMHIGFWMCWFQWHRFWGCTFRCFWVIGYMYALFWKLLIRVLLSEYFATLLKRLYLKKIAIKYSIFLHQLYFFLMKRSRTFFW